MSRVISEMDLRVDNHGTIFLLCPLSEVGEAWIAEHIPADVMTWADGVVVEHRYIADIVNGAMADGLKVIG